MSIEVVTLGEAMVALVASDTGPLAEATTFRRFVAGAEANVAVGLARLGHGAAFIGRVGPDGFGTAIVRRLRGEGVDVAGVAVDPEARTGIFVRERRLVGAAELVYHPSVAAAADRFSAGRWLHVTGITPALSASCRAAVDAAIDRAREAGMTISFDVNLRRKLWSEDEARPVLRAIAARSDVVFAGLDEAGVLLEASPGSANDAARALLDIGPSLAILKLGEAGALARQRDHPGAAHEGFAVPLVVDPVGAGDAF